MNPNPEHCITLETFNQWGAGRRVLRICGLGGTAHRCSELLHRRRSNPRAVEAGWDCGGVTCQRD